MLRWRLRHNVDGALEARPRVGVKFDCLFLVSCDPVIFRSQARTPSYPQRNLTFFIRCVRRDSVQLAGGTN